MDAQQIKTWAVRFNRARNNLLGVVILTLANLVMIALDVDIGFPFSAVIPQFILVWFIEISMPVVMTIAVIIVSFYLLFFFLSKRWRVFILIALIFFAMDTLFLLDFMLEFGFSGLLLNLAFHAWIHFYLITGTIAWAKLRKVSKEEFTELVAAVEQEAEKEELDYALDTVAPGDKDDSDKTNNDKNV